MKTIIIGGSAAGMGTAARLRRNDPNAEILVIQNKDYVSLGACGLPYFVGNEFDDPNNLIARTVQDFEKNNIKILTNSLVNQIDFDKKAVYINEKEYLYDNLVIATGAVPIVPSIPGIKLENVFTLTSLEDGINLKEKLNSKDIQKVAVIGAGFIGLEVCEALKHLNKEIHLVEMDSRVMARVVDEEISELIQEELDKNKIKTYLSSQLTEIKGNNNKVSYIILKDNTRIQVDAIIMSVGFKPNTDFLKETKLELNQKGAIIVNNKQETNIKNVYAGGDCATSINKITNEQIYSPLATVASKVAKVIADNIANKNATFAGSIQSAMIRIFNTEVARTGLTETECIEKNINYKKVFIKDKDHTNYVPNQSDLYLKIIMNQDTREIIGAQMVGSDKSILRINLLIGIIWNKIKVDNALEQIDLPYAPPFARSVDILHIALSILNK